MQKEFNTRANRLYVRNNQNEYTIADNDDILNAARKAITYKFRAGTCISSPNAARDYLQLKLAPYPHEVFAVVWLTTKHTVIAFEELFQGTIDKASVYPREIVRSALKQNAAACILCHNHPSGDTEPSMADKSITESVKTALELIEVRTLDHFIVGQNIFSFAERGIL